jgi:GPH family glycoside/pentoside/hexuronide:cation symporter
MPAAWRGASGGERVTSEGSDLSQDQRQVDAATRFFYGAGSIAYGVKDNGFAYFLLLYYNQVLGLPSHLASLAIFAALVVDAISDPIVGSLSDRLHSRWGRRHPLMYAAALPVTISFYFLWNPPDLGERELFYYLLGWAIAVRTFLTFFEVPSTALAPELTDRYDERTTLASIRHFFGWAGGIGIAVISYQFLLVPTDTQPTGQLNAAGYEAYGLVGGLMILAAILASSIGTHRRIPDLKSPPPKRRVSPRIALAEIAETLRNRSFISIFGYGIFASTGGGFAAAMSIYLNTYYWELASRQISWIVLSGFVSAAIALFAAPFLSIRLGKKRAAISAAIGAGLSYPMPIVLRWLEWAPANGSTELLVFLVFWNVVGIAFIISMQALVSAMMADIVEESELETGRRSEGLFFAARSFISKSLSGLGIVLATVLLALIGFPENARPGQLEPSIVNWLGLGYIPFVGALFLLAMACLGRYGISKDQHEANLQTLRERRIAG